MAIAAFVIVGLLPILATMSIVLWIALTQRNPLANSLAPSIALGLALGAVFGGTVGAALILTVRALVRLRAR